LEHKQKKCKFSFFIRIHEEKYVQYGEEIDEQNTEQTIIQNTQVIDNLNSKQTKLNYQPLAYESYK